MEEYLLALDQIDARLLALDQQLTDIAETAPYREPVGWLRCFRGINTLSAMLIFGRVARLPPIHVAPGVDGVRRPRAE